jgi:hypothetical protein
MNLVHYGIAGVLLLAAVQGLFFYSNLVKKVLAWCLFQVGLVVFLLLLMPPGRYLCLAVALLILAVTLSVGMFLGAFCVKLGRQYKTMNGAEISRRISK